MNEKEHVNNKVKVFMIHNNIKLMVGVNESFGMFKNGIIKINKLSKKKYLKMNDILGGKILKKIEGNNELFPSISGSLCKM